MENIIEVKKGEQTNHLIILRELLKDVRDQFHNVPSDDEMSKFFGATKTVAKTSFKISCKIEVLND